MCLDSNNGFIYRANAMSLRSVQEEFKSCITETRMQVPCFIGPVALNFKHDSAYVRNTTQKHNSSVSTYQGLRMYKNGVERHSNTMIICGHRQ